MADTTTDVRIVISEELPSSLATRLEELNLSLVGNAEAGCLALQRFFTLLTLYCVRSAESTLSETFPNRSTSLATSGDCLRDLRFKLAAAIDELATLPEEHPGASLFFRIFYVGGVKAKDTSPRRHSRLLEVGGKNIPGYRTLVEWCELSVGQDELKGEQRCNRELRRYLPVAKEWLQAIGKHTAKLPEVNLNDTDSPKTAPEIATTEGPASKSKPKIETKAQTATEAKAQPENQPPVTVEAVADAPKASETKNKGASPSAKTSQPVDTKASLSKAEPVAAESKTSVEIKSQEPAAASAQPQPKVEKAKPAAAKAAEVKTTPPVAEKPTVQVTKTEKAPGATKVEPTIPKEPDSAVRPAARKAESRTATSRASSGTKGHVPGIFTSPLKEMLVATQAKQTEKVNRQLSLISLRILQYSYSIGLATLDALDQPTSGFRLDGNIVPNSYQTLERKTEKLGLIEQYFQENSEDLSELESTIDLVQRLLAETLLSKDILLELAKLPTRQGFAAETTWAAKGLTKIKGWIEKAMPFCSRAEHYLDESTEEGVTFGVVQFGDWALEFEEKNLRIYSEFLTDSQVAELASAEALPEAKAAEPVAEVVPEAKAAEPTAEVVPEAKAAEAVAEVVPEAKAAEPTAKVVPEAKAAEPTAEVVPEAKAAEPTAEVVPEAKAAEPVAEIVPEAKAAEPTASVVAEAKADQAVAEVVPEAKAAEPTAEIVPEAKADQPVAEVVPEAKAAEATAEVVPEAKADQPVAEVVPEAKAAEATAEVVPEAKADQPVAEVVPEAKAAEPTAEIVPEAKADQPVAEVVPEAKTAEPESVTLSVPVSVDIKPETSTPEQVATKDHQQVEKQNEEEAAKSTPAEAILAGSSAAESAPAEQTLVEPAPVEPTASAPEVVVSAITPEEMDAEIVLSLQNCGAPSFLKSPWSSGQPLELRVRTLYDLWGQYFSAVLSTSETVRGVEHCAEAAPRAQASLRNQLVALKSSEAVAEFGAELAAVFWNDANEELPHTQLLSALDTDALCYPFGDQLRQWLLALKQWVEASQDFWGATEQLFEEPDSEGNLEGVIVYGELYLEFVEHPLDLKFPQAWAEAAPLSPPLETLPQTEAPKSEAVVEFGEPQAPQAPALNLEWDLVENAPPHILEQLEKLKNGELSREQALRQSYYFLVQYYAGVLACAGIQLRDLDVGMIEAYTHDSTIEARRDMLERLLPESLASESDVFKELAQVWNATDGQSIQLCSTASFLKASCSEELPVQWQDACAQWLRNSNHFWQHCEHHCEDSDEQRQDIVVQFKGDFFELVHPDYSLELEPKVALVPESEIIEAVAAVVSHSATRPAADPPVIAAEIVAEAAPVSPSEQLLGGVGVAVPADETLLEGVDAGVNALFVGAASPSDLLLDGPSSLEGIPAADSDSLFGAQAASSTDIDSLFQVEPETDWIEKLNQPTPVVEAPRVAKPKSTAPDPLAELFAVQSEPEAVKPVEAVPAVEEPKPKVRPAPKVDPMAAVDSTPKVSQSTSVVTDLLDSILSESEAKRVKAKESSDREAQEKAEKEKIEVAAKAELAAIEAGVTLPTGTPTLEVVVQYEEKKQGVHTGTLLLKNIGGGTLKGTLKSLHPSVRLRPTVFRENDTTVEFTIDDSDKPGNLKKNALAVNLQGGAKQELNFDRLLPAAGLAQIRTKVFDLVKQLGKSKKPKA